MVLVSFNGKEKDIVLNFSAQKTIWTVKGEMKGL